VAKEDYDAGIDRYRNAWDHAMRLNIKLVGHVVNGKLRLEFPGMTGETYAIEASTNLTDWITIGISTVETDGRFQFEHVPSGKHNIQFYRAKLLR